MVKMITTKYPNTTMTVNERPKGQREKVKKVIPKCVHKYNQYMGGVDRLDQNVQYYAFTRKSTKWTRNFVLYLIGIAVFNAFVIYRAKNPRGKYKTLLKFALAIIASWTSFSDGVDREESGEWRGEW